MPIIKYSAVHTTPKSHLAYIMNPDKNSDMQFLSVINCGSDVDSAYLDFKELFERFDSESFNNYGSDSGKQHIRIHSYIMSFDDEITPEYANAYGLYWAKKMFGEKRPVIISTHVNTGHVHNHIAVCPYDTDGKKWHANYRSLMRGRAISDEMARVRNMSVIENPQRNSTLNYSEWLALKNGTSWKLAMADNIDKLILSDDVTDIQSLIEKMKNNGYVFTDEQRMIAKPEKVKYGCCIANLGFGYSREMLEERINNKDSELPGRHFVSDNPYAIEVAVTLKNMQFDIYRTKKKAPQKPNYERALRDLKQSAALITYLSNQNIFSEEDFKEHVDYCNNIVEERIRTLKIRSGGTTFHSAYEIESYHRETDRLKEELEIFKAEKVDAAKFYSLFLSIKESDYDKYLNEEKTRREIDRLQEENYYRMKSEQQVTAHENSRGYYSR